MKILSTDKCATSFNMNDDCFLDSDILTVNEEVVGHSCHICFKDGMDDDELKAHAICHLEVGGCDGVVENYSNNTKSVKSRAKSTRVKVSHIKCKEDASEHLVYACTLCGMENIHVSLVAAHMKKQCVIYLNSGGQPSSDNYNSRVLSTKDEGSIENYGSDNIIEEIVTLFNPLISEMGVSTSDLSSLGNQLLEVNTQAEQKTVSKQSLVSCIATAGDNTSLQSALVYESIGTDDNSFRHLMENSIVEDSNSLKCNYCREYFVLEADLLKHQETWHANCENSLLCLICGKSYTRKNLLKRHVQTHELEPSTCNVCDKTFHNKMMLKTHTMMHTGKHPFKCSMCVKGFIFSSSLKKHMLKEHKVIEKDYQCNICTSAFQTKLGLKKHHEREHEQKGGTGNQYLCPTCGKTFSTSSSLGIHMVMHGPRKHVCKICGFRFHKKHMLKNHMLRHQRKKDLICETCGETFYLSNELRRHVFNQHTDDLPSKCTHCDRAFKLPHRLRRHMIFAHRIIPEGKEVFSCKICNQLFVNKLKLNDHMNLHTGARPYSCSECSHKCRSQHSLMQHREVHALVRKPKNSFPCAVCSRKFKNERTWRLHNQSVHLVATEKVPLYPCVDCDKHFSTMWMLNRHRILFHKDAATNSSQHHDCDLCEESFVSSFRLIKHKREKHGLVVEIPVKDSVCRSYQCTQCEKTYRTKSGLKQHNENKHKPRDRRRTYPCKLCGKILNSSSALYLHGRCIHGLNPREYKCETCGKIFKLKSGLTNHRRTHIDIKDREVYTCEICFKDLTTKWSHNVHMLIHRGIKPHVCDICGRAFTQSGDRNKHRLNTHKDILQASEAL